MCPDLEREVMNAIIQLKERAQWRAWGMNQIRKQGPAMLLYGPSGTGKTVIAEWIAVSMIKKGIKEVTFADFGSRVPGENARQLRKIFTEAADKHMPLYFDECDAVLMDRSKLGSDMKWMTEIINELLLLVGKCKELVIFSTNRISEIDPAIDRRLIAKIHVGIPEKRERELIWKQKWPRKYPLPLTPHIVDKLGDYVLTGAEIENTLIEATSDVIRRKATPTIDDICNVASRRIAK